jgi:hypothetical protein
MRHAIVTLSIAVLAAGCGTAESVSPAPTATGTAGSSTGSTSTSEGGSAGSGGAPMSMPIRTVEQRNPFGNVAATDNLLYDGDFEWTSPLSNQSGWLYGPPYDSGLPAATIGAACRSGVKCITVPEGKGLIGMGVGSKSEALSVSVFVKPETGACADVDVSLFDPVGAASDAPIPAASAAPDSTGWCLYQGAVQAYAKKVYLRIYNDTKGAIVVDNAVVRAAPQKEERHRR